MLEKAIERKLMTLTKERGGYCPKFTSPGTAGMPDRIIILPGGKMGFVEVKAPGQQPRPLQKVQHKKLRDLDIPVYVLDSPDTDTITGILDAIQAA
ncbi:VRR-NUC domain-containing protein [Corynebacterium lujinxingii]|uniref:VRR-NUC domain-containing protein n=1 Tax=Corynebacterium lujinxingii TaxID=2763010 RepID=A0A7H0K0R6_9CORY|nr:VRR-NUC domain-containing protein [Corynebacterium lujinxingii]MBC3179372.1 VRR-NUC domain-containing protein [Corynebacterium lujinxingii]NNO11482.1 VRR-NUC domain-containing protein [Corynebacterium lujinxingii]QNP90882.1 VRR-NUC domain-containing protein [Corynebacterium lujinxingii]